MFICLDIKIKFTSFFSKARVGFHRRTLSGLCTECQRTLSKVRLGWIRLAAGRWGHRACHGKLGHMSWPAPSAPWWPARCAGSRQTERASHPVLASRSRRHRQDQQLENGLRIQDAICTGQVSSNTSSPLCKYSDLLRFSILKAFRHRELSTHYLILDKFSNFSEDIFRFKIRMI